MICLYLKSVVFAMTANKAATRPCLEKNRSINPKGSFCVSCYLSWHSMVFLLVSTPNSGECASKKAKALHTKDFVVSLHVSLLIHFRLHSGYIGTCYVIQIIVKSSVTFCN